MNENQLPGVVSNAAFKVHTKTGPGLLESVYEIILAHELQKRGLRVERQKSIAITYGDLVVPDAFRADLVVEEKLIVELKSLDKITPVHSKQVLTQVRLSGCRLGLLINFGELHLKDGIERIVNGKLEP